jgi:hypothetical protein
LNPSEGTNEIKVFMPLFGIPEELTLHVRTQSDQAWQAIVLKSTKKSYIFQASIPGANSGETMEYYLSAADNSGRRGLI